MYEQQTEGKAIAMLAVIGLVGLMSFHSFLPNHSQRAEKQNNPSQVTALTSQ